ncbi:MAG: ABC transporter permease, partial [Rhodospirillales bacterium]|nr:ABC transporter permease [Rhodospirillales bacterium]
MAYAEDLTVGTAGTPVETPFRRFISDFAESKLAILGMAVFSVVLFCAVFAPFISPTDPYDLSQLSILENTLPPGSASMSGGTFLLGSDAQGRDILSGIFYGLRTSLFVGAMSGFIAFLVGLTIGLTSAYFGGRVDNVIMRVVDLQLSFPSILIALVLLAILGQGVDKIIIALIVVQWAYFARTVRGSALVERRREYIESAECLALGHQRIVFKHLLPNCMPPMIVIGTVQVAHAIALEATLSFLGLGLPPTEPSLGLLISNGFDYMLSGRYWISFFP